MGKQQFGLGEHVIASIRRVFQAHPEVEEVVLYGSRAKGNYKVGSDIDLTIRVSMSILNCSALLAMSYMNCQFLIWWIYRYYRILAMQI